jgi:hypothetical protein
VFNRGVSCEFQSALAVLIKATSGREKLRDCLNNAELERQELGAELGAVNLAVRGNNQAIRSGARRSDRPKPGASLTGLLVVSAFIGEWKTGKHGGFRRNKWPQMNVHLLRGPA